MMMKQPVYVTFHKQEITANYKETRVLTKVKADPPHIPDVTMNQNLIHGHVGNSQVMKCQNSVNHLGIEACVWYFGICLFMKKPFLLIFVLYLVIK